MPYKIHKLRLFLAFFACSLLFFAATPQFASASHAQCGDGTQVPESLTDPGIAVDFCESRGGLGGSDDSGSNTAGSQQTTGNFEADCKTEGELNKDNCGIVAYVVSFTRVLSGLVGIVIVIMITVGGIQYAAAGPDPGAVVAARKRIINAVIALVLYIFMFSFLQWLIPGGIF